MFFLGTLLALAAVTALLFAVPLRMKAWAALGLTLIGTLAVGIRAAATLAGAHYGPLWVISGTPFGGDSGSMDGLSALFVLVIAIGSVAAVLYSQGYLARHLQHKSPAHVSLHYTSLVTMCYAMLGVVLSDGGYSFLFFWELMTVASFLLILFDAERREVRRAALSYLIMMHIGFVLLLIGFVRLDVATGDTSFGALAAAFRTQPVLPLYLLFLAGFGMKAGLFPMHVWLPEAHPAAPSHVSALMSGVMIKTGVYGILRITAALGDLPELRTAGLILLGAGIVTGLWGVMLAAAQNDVKRLLAYSSIEHMGIIAIGFGIGGPLGERPRVAPGVAEAREDAVFRIVGHREGPALDGLGLVEQRFVGCGERRVPGRRFVAPVAVRFAFRGPAAAERRRFRLGREVPPFLEIPAFVLLVGHDELLGQRRASVDQEGAFFGHGDAEALLGGRTSRFDFQFRHTICVSDSLRNRRQ